VRRASLALAAGALVCSSASGAAANGRYPQSNQLAFSPTDPTLVVLRTTFGILISHDGGTTWSWLCEDVVGVPSTSIADPVLAVTQKSIVGAPEIANGLVVSSDSGCNWSTAGAPLSTQSIKDLVVKPDAPDDVLALTSTYGPDSGADGAPGYLQQVYESDDDGATWSPIGGSIDPSALVTTIDLAASDPARMYVSAIRGENATRTASLFVSADSGATWAEHSVPLDPTTESEIFIGGVDPTDADRVYIRTLGQPSRLLVTSDAGQTYQSALSLTGEMLGFALSADGSEVYAGSIEDGLFAGAREGLGFQNVSSIHVQCLAMHGADLWACSDAPSGFIAGLSTTKGAAFTAKAQLQAQPLVACEADSSAESTCSGAPWEALCLVLPGCSPDSGDVVSAAATPVGRSAPATMSHGCTASDQEGKAGGFAVAFGLASAFVYGYRRAARARSRAR
jgi:photosystem II stability/assembly factor-like uncharacterized protein